MYSSNNVDGCVSMNSSSICVWQPNRLHPVDVIALCVDLLSSGHSQGYRSTSVPHAEQRKSDAGPSRMCTDGWEQLLLVLFFWQNYL